VWKELEMNEYGIWYGEDIYPNVRQNRMVYHPKVLTGSCLSTRRRWTENAVVESTMRQLPSAEVIYDRVGIVPFHIEYNLFHFAEGLNNLVRYYATRRLDAPVIRLFVSSFIVYLFVSCSWFGVSFISWMVSWILDGCIVFHS